MSTSGKITADTHTYLMLTDTKLRTLKRRAAVYRVADSGGLAIEVKPTGTRLWRYRFRHNGKASMTSFGEYPATSLAEARALRDHARKTLRAGISPVVAARARRVAALEHAGNTFAVIATEFLDQRTKSLSPTGAARSRRLIEKDLKPYLGKFAITDVTAKMLLDVLRKIERRGAVETAHRARSLASQVFRYAIATGRAERDPSTDLRGALESPNVEHFASITEPAQAAQLLRAIHGYSGQPTTAAALKLAPLVFVRPGELRGALWDDINLDTAEWRYTASKTEQPHIVPLSTQAVAILRELHPLTGSIGSGKPGLPRYVFPSLRTRERPISENTVNAALRRMGFDKDTMTGHGFRAMARTILDEVLHFRPDYIEHQLAHAVRDPNGRAYNRTAHLAERKKMMQAWADYLDVLRTQSSIK